MIFSNLILGILTAYIGSITPSMLNMTAAKISIEKDKKTALQFAIGVSSVVFIQALLALLFLKAIHSNPLILDSIQIISIIIFMVLSIVFLKKALNEQKAIIPKKSLKNGFLTGIGLSFINMFSIPFYCGIGAVFNMYGWLSLELSKVMFFVIGAVIGTYLILNHYVLLAEKIKPKIAKFTKYLNFILAVITGFVAVFSLIKIL